MKDNPYQEAKKLLSKLTKDGITRNPLTKHCIVTYPPRHSLDPTKDVAAFYQKLDSLPKNTGIDLYVHFPYCSRACDFCNFYFRPGLENFDKQSEEYLSAIKEEIEILAGLTKNKVRLNSIYLGGGSPSLLKPKQIKEILDNINTKIDSIKEIEISLELHPEVIRLQGKEYLKQLKNIGISRISIGYQSCKDFLLKKVKRGHSSEEVHKLLKQVKDAGFIVNIDLMWGFEKQTVKDHQETLEKVIAIKPDVITTYFLEIRPNSPDYKKYLSLSENVDYQNKVIEMGILNRTLLENKNFEERTFDYWFGGRDFQHRKGKWSGKDSILLTLGPATYNWIFTGASENIVFYKPYDIDLWTREIKKGNYPIDRIIKLNKEETRRRHTMFALRQNFIQQAEISKIPELVKITNSLMKIGLMERDGHDLRLTNAGKLLNHEIAALFSSNEILEKASKNNTADELKYSSFPNAKFLLEFKKFIKQ